MRKYLMIFLALCLCGSLVACNKSAPASSASAEPSETVLKPIATHHEKVYEKGVNYSYYKLFEELLKNPGSIEEMITDVVKAKYIDTKKTDNCYYHSFELLENLRGLGVKNILTVRSKPEKRAFHDSDSEVFDTSVIGYEAGRSYLLLLKRSYTVADGINRFRAVDDSLILPLNDEGTVDAENAEIYGNRLLSHTFDIPLREALLDGTFEEYLLPEIKENVYMFNYENYGSYITETDTETMLAHAFFVFEVLITDTDRPSDRGPNDFEDIRVCSGKITKVYKSVEDIDTEDIKIELHVDRVREKEKYIFILSKIPGWDDPYYFLLASKDAMLDISEEENIKAILSTFKPTK